MKSKSESDQRVGGLRERKKLKTHAAIQQEAMRLFREQGYEATTVEQIAEAAEVSPSTFFRYFGTKEDVVLHDVYDPIIAEAFEGQPAELSPLQALRRALKSVYANMPPGELAEQRERMELIRSVPELRAMMLDDILRTTQEIAVLVARRVGRSADDLAVRTYAGAVIGALIPAMLAAFDDPAADIFALMDASLGLLEAGLPL